ncbi:MAG: type IV toxin-antitoxin system AbiEi family antitoxin [Polyangiaceae bacterium]
MSIPRDIPRQLRAIAAPDGPLTVLHTPGLLPYQGSAPHLAHPLLVYTELLSSPDPRMAEAAAELRGRFLKELA